MGKPRHHIGWHAINAHPAYRRETGACMHVVNFAIFFNPVFSCVVYLSIYSTACNHIPHMYIQ